MKPKGGINAANQRPPLLDLPPPLRMMFEPRGFIEIKPPMEKRTLPPYTGVAQFVKQFETQPPPPPMPFENPAERKQKMREMLEKLNREKNDMLIQDWDPHSLKNSTENAYHTLFVARLSYETNEKKLRREFEKYGPIKTVKMVNDLEGKPRGYAFIEFETEEDMTAALKRANGSKIDGKRIVLDVERGRTVRNWRPRRFGGGIAGRKPIKSRKELEEESRSQALAMAEKQSSVIYGSGSASSTSGTVRNDRDNRGGGGGGGRDNRDNRDFRGGNRGGGREGGDNAREDRPPMDRYGGGGGGGGAVNRRSRSRDRNQGGPRRDSSRERGNRGNDQRGNERGNERMRDQSGDMRNPMPQNSNYGPSNGDPYRPRDRR